MKILLAYDGGEPARRALVTAADIVKAMGGSVDVISVIPFHPGRMPIDPWDDRPVHDAELREAKTRLAEHGVPCRVTSPPATQRSRSRRQPATAPTTWSSSGPEASAR